MDLHDFRSAVPGYVPAQGDVVTLRDHERLCRVLEVNDPADRLAATDGFCVSVVLIGLLLDDVEHGWVEPKDLSLVVRP